MRSWHSLALTAIVAAPAAAVCVGPSLQATAVKGTFVSLPGTLPVTTQAYGWEACCTGQIGACWQLVLLLLAAFRCALAGTKQTDAAFAVCLPTWLLPCRICCHVEHPRCPWRAPTRPAQRWWSGIPPQRPPEVGWPCG